MAKKKGICRNEECEMCDPSIIQEADEFNFVCEKCGLELFPIGGVGGGGNDGKWKKWVIIGAAVAVLGVGGTILALCCGSDEAPKKGGETNIPPTTVVTTDSSVNKKTEEPKDTIIKEKPQTEKENTQTVKENPVDENTKPGQKPVVSPKNGFGSVNLGYGRYKGDLKNGKPHGHGTIIYTRMHQIVSSKDFVAYPGDKFEGEFRDGRISGGIGYWHHDGDITAVKP